MFRFVAVLLLVAGFGCSPPAADWNRFVAQFLEGYFAMNPMFAVNAGRHEFDGKLPDWSRAGIEKEIAWLREQRGRAEGFPASFERDYLISTIDGDLFALVTAQDPFRNPMYYGGVVDPDVYVTRDYAPAAQRLKALTAHLKALTTATEQIRMNLRTPMPRAFADIGQTVLGGLAGYLERDAPGYFKTVMDPGLQAEYRAASASAVNALRSLDEWFGEQRKKGTEEFPLGKEKFLQMLRDTERLDVTIEELEGAGQRDLDRNLAALREVCAQLAPGLKEAGCVQKMSAKKPADGPVEAAKRQLRDLKAFVAANDLVTIPGTEEARVAESPPHQRWNFAYIMIPGPYEKGLPSTYYIAPPDPKWTEAERKEYIPGEADLMFTSVHEVWPGHFLQFLHSNRAESQLGRVFVGYAFAEGWAHYAEEMMWDAGWGKGSPEMHIGQLTNALLRNVRYLSAIGLHTGRMSVAESEKMFREKAFTDAGTARQQAARGTFDPGYLKYTLGKLMIRKLRDDWTASRGGRKAWKEFHDRFLEYGGPPIPLVRAAMMGGNAGKAL